MDNSKKKFPMFAGVAVLVVLGIAFGYFSSSARLRGQLMPSSPSGTMMRATTSPTGSEAFMKEKEVNTDIVDQPEVIDCWSINKNAEKECNKKYETSIEDCNTARTACYSNLFSYYCEEQWEVCVAPMKRELLSCIEKAFRDQVACQKTQTRPCQHDRTNAITECDLAKDKNDQTINQQEAQCRIACPTLGDLENSCTKACVKEANERRSKSNTIYLQCLLSVPPSCANNANPKPSTQVMR